jgi:flagellar hook-length control protein FliK
LSGKSGAENEIKNSAENLVKNGKTITKLDLQKTIQPSANLSEKNIDSPINVIMNESAESADHELTSIIQQEKSPVLNRAEILPKPVSVSNFNSEIRETIFGQLTKAVNGVTKFKVALYPENFGKISIEISYSENAGLKINMIGDNPEATRILEQNLPSLRDNLQTEKLSELVVNLNSNRDSQGFGNKNSKSENENSGDSVKNDRAPAELVESDAMRRQEKLGVGSGDGLDTYV